MALPVLVDSVEVSDRLGQLGVSKDDLMQVIQAAVGARANATPFHPKSAPGMLAYIEGTFRLRSVLVSKGWECYVCRDNIESVFNESKNLKIVFQNADLAGHPFADPVPSSRKGPGSARVVAMGQSMLFPELSNELPPELRAKVWYLFVQAEGLDVRAELSCPISIQDDRFHGFSERIMLVQEGEWDTPDLSYDRQLPELEVKVSRKAS
ncbi:hypothetical protein [Eoetvoesiella caeni]|uniref:Uncharacterized protein n=1 Tax=Eoetvoesiella caeni TaxID=645616 RepID=A0A366H1A8_9BURK|nr:hypothetical protein [Eoetvoesiella caeni]MCI2811193.1 hypothetical protein [Eoetvoesiella caeni]NYT57047.1 hypothetical protein [Eoetvoesiella caeni]RBP35006.1 hypothetical protein DFR37_1227 [Eoetvoesiella caeni]